MLTSNRNAYYLKLDPNGEDLALSHTMLDPQCLTMATDNTDFYTVHLVGDCVPPA